MNRSAVKWLNTEIGKKKLYIVILAAAQSILGISGVLYALLLKNIIDSAAAKNYDGFTKYLFGIIALVLSQIALRALVRHVDVLARSTFENLLKGRLFSSLMKKDYASVTAVHSGKWINRLTNDAAVCANGLVEILPGSAGMLIQMCGALVMILLLEPKFMLILIPCGIVFMIVTHAFRKILKGLHKNIQEKDGRLRVFLQENLSSLLIVRCFSAEKQTEAEAYEKMSEHKKARMKRNRFSNLCNIGFSGAMNGVYLAGVGYCCFGIMNGTLSYGTLMAMLQMISQIQSPFANITSYIPRFYAMTASAERLMEIESFPDDCRRGVIPSEEVRRFYKEELTAVGLNGVSFKYLPRVNDGLNGSKENMPVVLKDISFQVQKGEFVAFTGHSGCGKSTMLKLLMCLYPLDEGELYLMTDKKQPLTNEWHRLFAYVPQGNQLISGTVREIVAFTDKSGMYEDDRIMKALEISCADEFISRLENGLDTELGESGKGLSEGQMQRLAVARAVFSDNPILLLDEATSALDEDTERRLLANLRKMTDKTVFIVTHRPTAFEICDKIIEFTENNIRTCLHKLL